MVLRRSYPSASCAREYIKLQEYANSAGRFMIHGKRKGGDQKIKRERPASWERGYCHCISTSRVASTAVASFKHAVVYNLTADERCVYNCGLVAWFGISIAD